MGRPAPSLRRISSVVVGTVALLSLLVCVALIVLSTRLNETTLVLANSVEAVRLTEEAEIDLLLYDRTTDPIARATYRNGMQTRLAEAFRFVSTDQQRRLLNVARVRVDAFLHGQGKVDEAYEVLDGLSDANVAQARLLHERAAQWGRWADMLGVVAGALLVAILAVVFWYLYGRAVRPLLTLAGAIRRYGEGDRAVRSDETGALEVREMAKRFNQMADSLAHAREAQMAFLAGVAHDLRNPLGVLRLSVTAVRTDSSSQERLHRTLDVIDRQVTRLDRMLSDFLDMARIEAGELRLQLGRADARDILQRMVELFEASSGQHVIQLSLPDEEVPLLCDTLRIEQVLGNLISNAIKYSPGGGQVVVSLRRDRAWAVIGVSDQGIGLSEEDRRRLFQPFRRAGTAAQIQSIPGAGLGLFVVKRIVESHAGDIDVESAPGQGSEFRVRLPLLRGAALSELPTDVDPASLGS